MSNQRIATTNERLLQLSGHVGAALKPLALGWSMKGFTKFSLASQPYFSLFPVGGARRREKYVWTLWPAYRGHPH